MRSVYRRLLIVIIMLLIPITSGCWDRTELNQSVVAVGDGIDMTDKGQIMFTAQLPLSSQPSSNEGEGPSFMSVSATGDTIAMASQDITLKNPRAILWQHIETMVLGEEMCRKGLFGILDAESRNRNIRKTAYVFVARNSRASDILNVPTEVEKIPALALGSLIEVQDTAIGIYSAATLEEFTAKSSDPGIEPAAPGVSIVQSAGDQPHLELSGTAVFKEGKLAGWLNEDESRGYRWLRPKMLTGGINTIKCPICGQPVVTETIRSENQIEPELRNGEITFNIKIREESFFYEQRCLHKLVTVPMIKVLNQLSNQLIRHQIMMAIRRAQALDSDIFGFGAAFRKKYPAQWKEIGGHWAEVFPNIKCNITVDSRIRRTNLLFRTVTIRY